MNPDTVSPEAGALRRRAEQRLLQQASNAPVPPPAAELQRLLHELQIYQLELELQNERLRESQAQLQAASERYVDHYDRAPVGYFSLTRDGTMTSMNLIGADWLGQPRAQLLGRPFVTFVAAADRPGFTAFLDRVFATGVKRTHQVDLAQACQPTMTVQIDASLSANGLECRAVAVDITERTRMKEQLQISEERFRLLAETAVDVLWTLTLEGRFTFVSPSVKQLRGFTPEEVIQQTFEDIFTPASLALVQAQFGRFLADYHAGVPRGTMRLELEHKCKDGSTVWADVIACLPDNAGSSIVEIFGITRDISERKAAEKAIRESEARVRRLVEWAPIPMGLIDQHQEIVFYNKEFERMFGYTEADISTLHETYRRLARDVRSKTMAQCHHESIRIGPLEYNVACKSGDIRNLELFAISLEGEVLVAFVDLTKLHQAEAAKRLSLAEHTRMTERDRLLQDLHDGFASQLATACLRTEHSQFDKDQTSALLRECLDDLYLVIDTLGNADRTLNEAIADYRYRCDSRLSGMTEHLDWEIELCDCPPFGPRTILNIMRILQESLNNAVKHAQARQIRVDTRCHADGTLRIAVCDDGLGLPLALRMGRGLTNMQKRARELGGTLEFIRLRPGTRVSLSLPMGQPPLSDFS